MDEKKFSEVYSCWKEEKSRTVKQSTMSLYSYLAERWLVPAFGESVRIDGRAVQAFADGRLACGSSVRAVRQMLHVLRMIAGYGGRHGMMEYEAWNVVLPPQRHACEVQVFSVADQRRMMQWLDGHFSFRNLGIYICLCTGLRIGEICGLRWTDVDAAEGVIHVRRTVSRIYVGEGGERQTRIVVSTPKTERSARTVPMGSDLQRKMRRLMPLVSGDCYVVSNDNEPLEPRRYRSYYAGVMRRLGLPPLKFHALRHSFATRCIESRCDCKTVSAILGHSTVSTTLNLYVHPGIEERRKCVNKMLRSLMK